MRGHRRSWHRNHHWRHNRRFRPYHSHYRRPPLNLGPFWGSLLISLVISGISYFFGFWILDLLLAASWGVFSFSLMMRLVRWANRVDLYDDMKLWGLKLLAGLVAAVSSLFIYVFFIAWFTSLLSKTKVNPFLTGGLIVAIGLAFAGAFIAFRTKRRHGHFFVTNR